MVGQAVRLQFVMEGAEHYIEKNLYCDEFPLPNGGKR